MNFSFHNNIQQAIDAICHLYRYIFVFPDSKVHGANMRPIRGRQDPEGPHVGPMNLAIWFEIQLKCQFNAFIKYRLRIVYTTRLEVHQIYFQIVLVINIPL